MDGLFFDRTFFACPPAEALLRLLTYCRFIIIIVITIIVIIIVIIV